MSDGWAFVRAEREAVADFLESLSEEQWDKPSLCSQWRVRDVVGHLIGSTEIRVSPALIVEMLRARFDVNRVIARDGVRRGQAEPAQLVAGLRAVAGRQTLPPGVKRPQGMLVDVVLHHQDIRRPLGRPRTIPENHLREVLDELKGYRSSAFSAVDKIAGLRLVATDLDWSHGEGPEVRGTGEALAMAMGGRYAAMADLEGAGTGQLARSIDPQHV